MSLPDYFLTYMKKMTVENSFDQETTSTSPSTSIPRSNNHYFRDSSTDSSDSNDELSTTPTTPTTPTFQNTNTIIDNPPNMQRRASESITAEVIQFNKLPIARRYTLPGRINPSATTTGNTENNNLRSPLARFWGIGRDSSVQVAMENVQFGL